MVNQIEATKFTGRNNGSSEPVVVVPYAPTAPYPRDVVCISNGHKSHTGLIATIIGLAAAGGTFYACKGKDMPELQKGFQKLLQDLKKSVNEFFKKGPTEAEKAEKTAVTGRTPTPGEVTSIAKNSKNIASRISHARHYLTDEIGKTEKTIEEIEGKLGLNRDAFNEQHQPNIFERAWFYLFRGEKGRTNHAIEKLDLSPDKVSAYKADLKAHKARIERLRKTVEQLNTQEDKFNKHAKNFNPKELNALYKDLLKEGMPPIES